MPSILLLLLEETQEAFILACGPRAFACPFAQAFDIFFALFIERCRIVDGVADIVRRHFSILVERGKQGTHHGLLNLRS